MLLLHLCTGDDEKAYWDKLNQQRLNQRTNKTKTKRATNKKGFKKVCIYPVLLFFYVFHTAAIHSQVQQQVTICVNNFL